MAGNRLLGIYQVEACKVVGSFEFRSFLQISCLVQIEALALKLHLLEIVALL